MTDITLPLAIAGHCQLTDQDGQVLILGGEVDVGVSSSEFYILNKNDQYIVMPDIPEPIFEATCGLIENSVNGQEIVVLANSGVTYIFNFDNNSWRTGPNGYPSTDFSYAATVQTGNTFIKVGGETGFSPSNTLYRFDEENYDWVLLPQTLSVNRYGAVAIPLPDDFATC